MALLGDFGHAFTAFFAAVGAFHAVLVNGFAVFPGKNAEEIHEDAGRGIGTRSEGEGALFDSVEAGGVDINAPASEESQEVLDGRGVVTGDLKLLSEVEPRTVAVEAIE